MTVTSSIQGQLHLLNQHVGELNVWLEEQEVDEEFPTLHVLGTPTAEIIEDAVESHERELARFERRLRREADVDAGGLTEHTRTIKFDCARISSLFTSTA